MTPPITFFSSFVMLLPQFVLLDVPGKLVTSVFRLRLLLLKAFFCFLFAKKLRDDEERERLVDLYLDEGTLRCSGKRMGVMLRLAGIWHSLNRESGDDGAGVIS